MKNFDERIADIHEKTNRKTTQTKKRRKILLSSAFSLCLIIVIAIGALNFISNHSAPQNTASPDAIIASLRGLAVEPDPLLGKNDNPLADRFVPRKLSDFFSASLTPDAFAFVRVIDTNQYVDKTNHYRPYYQESDVEVILSIWSQVSPLPKQLKIVQSLNTGVSLDDKNILVRKNGVYLLPLIKDEKEKTWHIRFDHDVLFEVDHEGKIWSHSFIERFSDYDGKEATLLSDEIFRMTSSENFLPAISKFGQTIRDWDPHGTGVLASVSVSDVTNTRNKWNVEQYQYTFSEFNPVLETDKQNIGAYSYDAVMKAGLKYLVLLWYSEEPPSVTSYQTARIQDNGAISPANDEEYNIFAQYYGYTIEQIKLEAEKAILWEKEFGDK